MMLHSINIFLFICLIVIFTGCTGKNCNVLPDISFSITFSQADASSAFSPGGNATIKGGVGGLIVHNISTSANRYEFIAYDRCSPVNPHERNQIEVINNYIAKDPISGAEWLLLDGSPTKVAECPLKAYRVSGMGNTYTVRN